jgi:hypothetical protein
MPSGAAPTALAGAIATICCPESSTGRHNDDSGLPVIVFMRASDPASLHRRDPCVARTAAKPCASMAKASTASLPSALRRELNAVVEVEVTNPSSAGTEISRPPRHTRCGSRWSTPSDRPAASGWQNAVAMGWVIGLPAGLVRKGATPRSMVAMRRVASPSRSVMPFQMPQTFSQLSQPTPLKKANCRSSVLCAPSDP